MARGQANRFSEGEAQERFTELYRDTYQQILAYALRRTSNRQDADDAVASTYLVAWRRLENALDTDNPLPWLYGVAYKTLLNQRRAQRRASAVVDRATQHREMPNSGTIEDRVGAQLELAEVVQALDSLNSRDQEVLRLAGFEGLGPSEIAVVLGVSAPKARNHLYRARTRLRAALNDQRRNHGEQP